MQRVHTLLAQRGVFSPRVMQFLDVRVQARFSGSTTEAWLMMLVCCWKSGAAEEDGC